MSSTTRMPPVSIEPAIFANDGNSFDPWMLPTLLGLNDAIMRLTDDMVAHDPNVFASGNTNIRHVVERQLYFALVADRAFHEYFVACQTQDGAADAEHLTIWGRQIAPYLQGRHPDFGEAPPWRTRILRYWHRLRGDAEITMEGCDAGRPAVLFLVIHPKFVRYLLPLAEKLSLPYAFLTIEDPAMFDVLREQALPRVALELTAESLDMTRPQVEVLRRTLNQGLFDAWLIRLNAFRRALKSLAPDCIVVPEGNAPIYELVNQSARTAKIPTVCIQQGWSPIVHPGFRNMSYTGMCVWGQKFADLLAPYNPKQRFVITGNHVIDCQMQGDVGKRKVVAFFLQNGAHWITPATWQSMLDFVTWTAKSFPDYEIRVRAHPGEPLLPADVSRLTAADNATVLLPDKVSLRDTLSGCRVAIAMTSTTIVEAAASGAVSLILDVNGFGGYSPDIAKEGAAIEVTNFKDACVALDRLLRDDEYCASFAASIDRVRPSLFAQDADRALDAIVKEVRHVAGY